MTPFWLRRFLCWLTGGHRYEDKNLTTYYSPMNRKTVFANYCVKCGTQNLWELDIDRILQEDIERKKKGVIPNDR